MNVLILGGSGQLGSQLLKFFPDAKYTCREKDPIGNGIKVDFTSYMQIYDMIIKSMPEVIINTVAVTDVDLCERDRSYAYSVNSEAVKYIARASAAVKAYLIHVSTDYVFDGERGFYSEDDTPNPINYYGLTKLLGEAYALSYDYSLVIRTSGVFLNKGFPSFVMKQLKEDKTVNAFKGYYSPISAFKLAESIASLIKIKETGILNVAGERITRHDLAMRIAEAYNLPKNIVETDKINWLARRPYDSSLKISKAKRLLANDFFDISLNIAHLQQ
ncbi:MAG: SDR family oxidoreductase [Nitrososphaerota archaeon]|nr:SDR family oxidoreductase [Nitrososphaerota archaeon]